MLGALALSVTWALSPPQGVAQVPDRIIQAATALRHGSLEEAERAILRLGELRGSRFAAMALSRALEDGLPDPLIGPSLSALARLEVPSALPTFATLTSHRRWQVRLAAYRGLVELAHKEAPAYLEGGLGDSDPRVRAACARGLATLDAEASTETLLLALRRGVAEAAPAIGQLGDGDTAEAYGEQLGVQPMDVMLRGYWAFLERRDLPEADKLAIIVRLQEVATPEVRRFLQRILVAVNWRRQPRAKRAIEQTIARIQDAPASPPQPAPTGTGDSTTTGANAGTGVAR